jgi:hypothetical protein
MPVFPVAITFNFLKFLIPKNRFPFYPLINNKKYPW